MLGVAITPGILTSVATLATIELTGTVKLLAVVISLLAGLATIIGILFGVKWKIAYAVENKAREGEAALNETLEDRIRSLAHDREDLKAKLEESTSALLKADAAIARLEPLNDMARVLELVTDSFERLVNRQEEMHNENKRDVEARMQMLIKQFDRISDVAA